MKNKFQCEQFSLHEFSSRKNIPFDPKEYSMLKHGSGTVAKDYGRALANAFYKNYRDKIENKSLVVVESAYAFVKNAASVMTEYFLERLNEMLQDDEREAATHLKINRIANHISDYGKLSKEEREAHVDSATYSFDSDFAKDKFLLFIDDVIITGSHQLKIESMLRKYKLNTDDALFLYFAKYTGKGSPTIESHLNNNEIKDVADLYHLIMSEFNSGGAYHVIVRTLKLVLGWKNNGQVVQFARQVPPFVLKEMFNEMVGEGYSYKPEYKENFLTIKQYSEIRNGNY